MTRRSWAQLLGLSALWGSSYLFISIALRGVGPFALVFVRVAVAALILFPIVWRRRAQLARRWPVLLLVGVPQIALPFTLISAGEQHIDSGLAGTLIALMPLWLVVLSPALGRGRPTLQAIGGTLVGLAGVAILLGGIGTGTDVHLGGALLVVLAAAAYAVGAVLLARWGAGVDSVALTGVTTAGAALVLLPFAAFDLPERMPSVEVLGSLATLAVGCTAAAYILYNRLIADAGPEKAGLVAYLAPTFAVAYGAVLLNEPLGPGTFAGLALILAGSWLVTRKVRKVKTRVTPRESARTGNMSG